MPSLSIPPKPATDANYISDDDDGALPDLDGTYSDSDDDNEAEHTVLHLRARRSKRVIQQLERMKKTAYTALPP